MTEETDWGSIGVFHTKWAGMKWGRGGETLKATDNCAKVTSRSSLKTTTLVTPRTECTHAEAAVEFCVDAHTTTTQTRKLRHVTLWDNGGVPLKFR